MVPSAAPGGEPNVMLHWPMPGEASSQRPAMLTGGRAGTAGVAMGPDSGKPLPVQPTSANVITAASAEKRNAESMSELGMSFYLFHRANVSNPPAVRHICRRGAALGANFRRFANI